MQKKFAFATIAVAGLATAASAQIRLSHSFEEFLVTQGAGIACAAGDDPATPEVEPQTTVDNQWSRSFTLSDFGVTEAFTVNTVEFGVETVRFETLTEMDITINLYQIPAGSAPILGGELVGTTVFTTGELPGLEVITVDVMGSLDAGSALMVEIAAEDLLASAGGQFGDVFFIGGNSFGQDAPSYLGSTGCGLPDPTDIALLGDPPFIDNHWIIIAEGDVGASCRADLDGDGVLTIFDFLEFQNAFDAMDPIADFDGDGVFTIFDFLTFQNEFDAGC